MIKIKELNAQNHQITDISNVLSVLIENRLICDSETCGDLFHKYIELINDHIHTVDSNLYASLLGHSSKEANDTAKNFMSGSQETKRIVNTYMKKWCDKKCKKISIGSQHTVFLRETDYLFNMVLNRIQDETEHLYPMVRKINDGSF